MGWPQREYTKTAKNGNFCEEFLSENDLEALLATFCCYDYGANASEAVQNIAIDQKEIKMLGYQDTSDVAKKAAEVAQKKEQ